MGQALLLSSPFTDMEMEVQTGWELGSPDIQSSTLSNFSPECLRKGPGRYRQGAFSAAGMITAEGLSQLPCPSPACRLLRCPPPTPTLPRAFLRTQLLASTWERCQGSVPLPSDLARSQSLN